MDHFTQQTFNRTLHTSTKQGVNDEIRGVNGGLHRLPVGRCSHHANFAARLLPAISICGCVPTHLILSGNQDHDGRRARVGQMSRSYKPVSSIISLPTKNDDSPRFEPPKPCAHKVGNALACIFHQRQAGNTVALGCKAIDFAHLRSGQNFHGQSLIVVSL